SDRSSENPDTSGSAVSPPRSRPRIHEQNNHGSPVELARPLWPRAFARQTPDHYTQPNVHRRLTRSRTRQTFRTRTTAEAKCCMRGSRLDQAMLSRNAVPRLGVLV